MKKVCLSLLSLFITYVSFAQNSILAGKIVDEDNMPIPGAIIKVSRGGDVIKVSADNDGLFYTRLLPAGNYHVDVIIDKRRLNARKVYLTDATKKKSYYYLRVVGDKVMISIDGQDPFMRAKLTRIENEDPLHEILGSGRDFLIITDKAGKIKESYIGPYEGLPKISDVK